MAVTAAFTAGDGDGEGLGGCDDGGGSSGGGGCSDENVDGERGVG